jgi:hypothetical protein
MIFNVPCNDLVLYGYLELLLLRVFNFDYH